MLHFAGSKQFRLLPPHKANDLLMYGRHHPYSCQSRYEDLLTATRFKRKELDVLLDVHSKYELISINSDSETCENMYTTGSISSGSYTAHDVLEVILHPGDVLFIPAFWFHEATALTCSMSVSYWWDSPVANIMDGKNIAL